jgi:hypothetical protein
VLDPVTAVVGTLAGYVAGHAAGAAGKERAEERAAAAKDEATQAQRQLGAVAGLGAAKTGEDLMSEARAQFRSGSRSSRAKEAERIPSTRVGRYSACPTASRLARLWPLRRMSTCGRAARIPRASGS